jgi:hypothetical protein
MMKDTFRAKGTVQIDVFNKDGELIETFTHHNLIVNVGKQSMARLLGSGTAGKVVDTIGFGSDGTDPAGADTSITSGFTKALDGVSYSGTSAVFAFALELGENNGATIREFALFSNDATMFSRMTRTAIVKTADIRLSGTWTITF